MVHAPATILEFKNIAKRFGKHQVLRDVDVRIMAGDAYLLLGRNGEGKTTLFSIALGLYKQDAGEVICSEPATGAISGYVNSPTFFPELSGMENIVLAGRLIGKRIREGEVHDLSERFSMTEALRKRTLTYSAGMLKKLGMMRAVLTGSKVIFLDEPLSGLDPEGIRELRLTIAFLRDEAGLTIVLSSHILAEMQKVATRIGVLSRGRIVAEKHVSDIFPEEPVYILRVTNPEESVAALGSIRELRVMEAGGEVLKIQTTMDDEEALKQAMRAGVKVREFYKQKPDLEEFFLNADAEKGDRW